MSDAGRVREFAVRVVRELQRAGYQALWAGGCVRDLILGETPADYDVATNATPEQVMAVLPYRAITVGISFGVVRVREPGGGGAEVEVATFRSDGAYVDGRRPETVVFGSAEVDATRRDFTINGMFMDPLTDDVIDYVGGLADLRARVLRAIGDPVARFREDKLRLLRAVRMAGRFGLEIEPETLRAITEMAGEVTTVSVERIAQELRKALGHETRARTMNLALETGVLGVIIPEVHSLRGGLTEMPPELGQDLWNHTLEVLTRLREPVSFTLGFAALLHELGRRTGGIEEGLGGLEEEGARTADRICREMKLSNFERERIGWLVANQRVLVGAKNLREAKLKRIMAEPGIGELIELHRADAVALGVSLESVEYCEYYLKEQPAGPINPAPLLSGNDLKAHGLTPGPRFAELLRAVREAQLDGEIETKEEALAWVVGRGEKPGNEVGG